MGSRFAAHPKNENIATPFARGLGAFLVETGAFLLVVTAFRNEIAVGAEGPLLRSGTSLC